MASDFCLYVSFIRTNTHKKNFAHTENRNNDKWSYRHHFKGAINTPQEKINFVVNRETFLGFLKGERRILSFSPSRLTICFHLFCSLSAVFR